MELDYFIWAGQFIAACCVLYACINLLDKFEEWVSISFHSKLIRAFLYSGYFLFWLIVLGSIGFEAIGY